MVNLFFIKTFVSVAKTGSCAIAAKENSITQPAVSQHIRLLEKKVGSTLFDRHVKKMCLTPDGKIFFSHAENILKEYEDAKIQILGQRNQFNCKIRIATIYSIGLHELPLIVKKFLNSYPEITIHLEYYHSKSIYEMVLDRKIDFGLVAYPKRAHGVNVTIFAEDKLVLVQSSYQPVFKKKIINLSDLHHVKFVAFSTDTPTGKTIDKFLRKEKIHPRITHIYDNIETLKSAVEIGMGCSIVPKNTVTQEIKNHILDIVHVRNFNLKRQLGILYPYKKKLTKCDQVFYDAIMKNGAKRDIAFVAP